MPLKGLRLTFDIRRRRLFSSTRAVLLNYRIVIQTIFLNLIGSFGFDFTRVYFDQNLLPKASAEIYEMTRSFAEMRELRYKIKDGEWSHLANKTGLLFFKMNNELLKQREKLLMPPS